MSTYNIVGVFKSKNWELGIAYSLILCYITLDGFEIEMPSLYCYPLWAATSIHLDYRAQYYSVYLQQKKMVGCIYCQKCIFTLLDEEIMAYAL